jgi:hypothetical protein
VLLVVSPFNVGALDVSVNGRRVAWRKVQVGPTPGPYNVGLTLPDGVHDVAVTSAGLGRTVLERVVVSREGQLIPMNMVGTAHVYLELPPAQARRIADGSIDVRMQSGGHETWFFPPGGAQNPNSIYTLLSGGDHTLDVTFVGYGSVRIAVRDLRSGERRTLQVTGPL